MVSLSWWTMAAVAATLGSRHTTIPGDWGRARDPTERCSLHNQLPGYSLGRVNKGVDHPERPGRLPRPSLFDLARFVLFSGLTLLAA